MSVLLEFTVDAEQFKLGNVLSTAGDLEFELERIVPTNSHMMPFVWAATDDALDVTLPGFEERLRDSEHVRELVALDRMEDGALYRIEWKEHDDGLLKALADTEATVLEAWGYETWTFRVRFPDHGGLTDFHNYLVDYDITIHIERTYTFARESARRRDFGLTPEQREALVLALQRGYFATPSEVGLGELADELGISKQAVSNRIRRGNEKILQPLLLSSAVD
jgi:predicted DNA binding protein